ncbi:hypothetical protein [Pontibacter beigongshangensis]|uniref:hypothetical protein n=1 Tax=Pontibacter beigongshangensis TaxID=2574733 RepID=UPI00164F5AB8|nr:hypothetical protein [Pontibacter beigongshangensis]
MFKFSVLGLLLLAVTTLSNAQRHVTYTNDNSIFITIEGDSSLYEYSTSEMLVRYNENTQKIECIIHVASLLPLNNYSPAVLPQDIFFAANYPELHIQIEAPEEKINAGNLYTERLDRGIGMFIQNMPVNITAPVVFTPDKRSLKLATTFELILPEYSIAIPAKYTSMLTGRVRFAIQNARSVEFFPR